MNNVKILVAAAVLLSACGVEQADVDNDTLNTDGAELSASARTYVTVQRDYRKCAWPMCSGWFVTDVNRKNPTPKYVVSLDFTNAKLDADTVKKAQEGELVLRGKLSAVAANGFQNFLVSDAWRGLPGVTSGAEFFLVSKINIQCIKAPCPTMKATRLNAGGSVNFDVLDVKDAALPRVDQTWLASRIMEHGAIVTGTVVDGKLVSGTHEKVLKVSQVFVKLPDLVGPCPLAKMPPCASGKVRSYVRDENRCVLPGACVTPGACALFVPTCNEGYALQSWSGGQFACTVYACDPEFVITPRE